MPSRKRLPNISRVAKLRKRSRCLDFRSFYLTSSSSDNEQNSDKDEQSQRSCESILSEQCVDSESNLQSIESCASLDSIPYLTSHRDLNINELNLLISYTFKQCNLNKEATKKIYNLMKFVSKINLALEDYNKFRSYIKSINLINSKTLVYCKNHATFESTQTCQCIDNIGYLIIFDYIDTIKLILERNYNELTIGQKTEIMLTKAYNNLWQDLGESIYKVIRISLICNLDDAQMLRSSRTCCTPISCIIAELPRRKRISKHNIFNLGLYWGVSGVKPDDLFSKCVEDAFHSLFMITDTDCNTTHQINESKFAMNINDKDLIVISRFLACTCDSVAKAKLLNVKMFNGKFGCPYCLHPTKSVVTPGTDSRKLVYHFESEYEKKTCLFYQEKSANLDPAVENQGIKGPTNLKKYLMVPCSCPIDYMHAILEGVFKFLMSMKPFSTNTVRSYIDGKVKIISLHHDTSRKFRKLSEIAYWKSSESRTFLLYLIPLFREVISTDCFIILLALSTITRSLCSDNLTDIQLQNIKTLIIKSTLAIQDIYGECNMRFNLHLLLHLVDQYKVFGSLADLSVFSFENNIFNLKRSFHGTRGQLNQMKDAYIFKMSITSRIELVDEVFQKACLDTGSKSKNTLKVLDPKFKIERSLMQKLRILYPSIRETDIDIYQSFTKNFETFHSSNYRYRKGSCSFYVKYRKHDSTSLYGEIRCFIAVKCQSNHFDNNYDKIYGLVRCFPKMQRMNVLSGLDAPITSHARQMMKIDLLKEHYIVVQSSSIEDHLIKRMTSIVVIYCCIYKWHQNELVTYSLTWHLQVHHYQCVLTNFSTQFISFFDLPD